MDQLLPAPKGCPLVVGLDGEMSGTELAEGSRLIQAGFAAIVEGRIEIFSSLIGSPIDSWDGLSWSEGAEAIHGISREQLAGAPSAEEVDLAAQRWLLDRGAQIGRRNVLSVGFNVGAFDHPFFRRYLPRSMELVNRRHIDLNSVCFTLDGLATLDGIRDWESWKKALKAAAAPVVSELAPAAHDAGYDAAEAIYGWQWLRDQIRADR